MELIDSDAKKVYDTPEQVRSIFYTLTTLEKLISKMVDPFILSKKYSVSEIIQCVDYMSGLKSRMFETVNRAYPELKGKSMRIGEENIEVIDDENK